MSARKHLPRLFAALAIALAAATSFAPRARAAAEIDEYARYELLADALERVVKMYERYDTGDSSDYRKAESEIDDAMLDARIFANILHSALGYDWDGVSDFTFSTFYIEHMEGAFLIEPGSLSAGSKLPDLAGFDESRADFLELYETARCLQHFLDDEYEALRFDVPLADRVSYLKGAIGALRSGEVDDFNRAARRVQYTGTIEASGDDAATDAAAPAIFAGITVVAVGAAVFVIVSRRRRS